MTAPQYHVRNSARSNMAEGILNHHSKGLFRAYSQAVIPPAKSARYDFLSYKVGNRAKRDPSFSKAPYSPTGINRLGFTKHPAPLVFHSPPSEYLTRVN